MTDSSARKSPSPSRRAADLDSLSCIRRLLEVVENDRPSKGSGWNTGMIRRFRRRDQYRDDLGEWDSRSRKAHPTAKRAISVGGPTKVPLRDPVGVELEAPGAEQ